ncbi:uncharacterized protein [Chelonus insularis]|uniref:uncharacterized protein n=1 Tax=Chelonus insularis TaxID=460826 RepID=UPI00158E953F|nr:uncharacterized protein LOC118064589 [Chelonus insularis]XP_034935169.1 uncharacterized protein LOC118064589 [Chelonus insularis]XP_034935170.1 uncharacterized protein LOC118064589 [Chelonus insularis]XP_034935171.1 uncharacterized protein LOC118064589 [Chelonus insularis]XP_034935173.1 uncharacterized protein LOC118064589 [Chelonus insularis]
MSADSPRRRLQKGVQVVLPQPVNDRSIIDSVAGIINDIVPQAYASTPAADNKESITWARFEYADINDPSFFPDHVEGSSAPPLLLVLGYTSGVQAWLVAASGEATEILSWRQGVVRTLRILPNPKTGDDNSDAYEQKRPVIAICDSSGPGPQFCSVNFVSLRTGEQLKSIKFKNPVCDILANRRSIAVTFSEKIAIFDARTFEDALTITTCYPCPGPNPNPVALGTRWFAYSEKKLVPSRRSSGGSEGEGVQSYTAAVLYAAKSLGKGLRGLGETVASSLTGNSITPMTFNNPVGDVSQPGVVTILDLHVTKQEKDLDDSPTETIVAHFTAHNDAIVAMTFDKTGAILMTADRRGHDFHIFKIQPHPGGPTLTAVHHLYVLHRGDTTAKVQDMVFSNDTRWAAIATVRGTTHVFPVAPYGGSVGMRTHSTPHVVNKLSRFHKSAGLTDDGTRSHSPVSHSEVPLCVYPYSNPRLPPYPHPTILHPLAQIRQPSSLNHANNQSQPRPQQRQRLHSEDNGMLPLKICACFAAPRAWIYSQRDLINKNMKRVTESLFIMSCDGNMIQYDLEPKPATGVPKEKVCDDTMIELEIEAKGQWSLLRASHSPEMTPPLLLSNPLLCHPGVPRSIQHIDCAEDRWLSQVEILTHAGPHRRLWMGPQFIFKTYNTHSGSNTAESEAIEIGVIGGSRPARSNPVNMPQPAARSLVPVVIDGSGSSYEQSPRFVEHYEDAVENDTSNIGNGENQLREDLAEAMLETSTASYRVPGRRLVVERVGQPVTKVVNPLGTVITVLADEEDASSKEEYEQEEQEYIPEGLKSVCAEEGPSSLGDFDTEGNPLRNLTKICAEINTADEPAIDSVPDESIKEVKEQKTLCVEQVVMSSSNTSIDFEKEKSFHDISTSLNICAESGEIPDSPMTQAKETCWKSKDFKERSETQGSLTDAKYVVSYDEKRVVLKENILDTDNEKHRHSEELKSPTNSENLSKRSSKSSHNFRGNKRLISVQKDRPKYLLREHGDSIVIEDNCTPVENKTTDSHLKEDNKRALVEKLNLEEESKAACRKQTTAVMVVETLKNPSDELIIPLVEPKIVDEKIVKNIHQNISEPMEAATACGIATLPSNLSVPADDLNCVDYHVIEPNIFRLKNTMYPHQFDDDMVHIPSHEDILKIIDVKMEQCENEYLETSFIHQRKSSKSTISDDDLEHIQTSELFDLFEKAKSLLVEKNDKPNIPESIQTQAKSSTSSDDELEHVNSETSSCSNQLSPPLTLVQPPSTVEQSVSSKTVGKSLWKDESINKSSNKSRTSRKRKDIVVIDSEPGSQPGISVIVKGFDNVENWNKSKSPEKDLNEEIDRCIEPKNQILAPSCTSNAQSLPKKTRVRTSKSSTSNLVEIIDIDALQKAEMEVTNISPIPECQVLEMCPAISTAKLKKSRRNKDTSTESDNTKSVSTNVNEPKSVDKLPKSGDWTLNISTLESTSEIDKKAKKLESCGKVLDPLKTSPTSKDKIINEPEMPKNQKEKFSRLYSTEISTEDHLRNSKSLKIIEPPSEDTCPVPEETALIAASCLESLKPTQDPEPVVNEVNSLDIESKIHLDEVKNVSIEEAGKNSEEKEKPKRSSSLEKLIPHEIPMDTEEDTAMKDGDKNNSAAVVLPTWSAVAKKNNRSKKKKRR